MINDALRIIRVYHNRKQNEVARDLGVSNSFLSQIESGQKQPTLDLLNQYARVFDMPVSSIILFSERQENANASTPESVLTRKVLKMLDWLETVTRPSEGLKSHS